jgi:hypothetical protein
MTDTPQTPVTASIQDIDSERPTAEPPTADTQPAEPDDISRATATLLVAIRTAVARGASSEARAAGVTACRSLLTVLEAKPGQALAATAPPSASPASPLLAMIQQPGFLTKLAALSREQLLDLLRQVTGALPAKVSSPTMAGPRFHLIQIPQLRRPSGGG